MVEYPNADVEDAIIQGLDNRERRNILKIIKLAREGAIYSDIMGELKLNSGLLNYHLRQLEGLITKNAQGRYILTPLGERALRGLNTINENLENGYGEYVKKAKVRQKFSLYISMAAILTIVASCVSLVLGYIGIIFATSGHLSYDQRELSWLFIAVFALPSFALGLKAGMSIFRRDRLVFCLAVNSLLLVPAIASIIVFKNTSGTGGMGALLAFAVGLPMIVLLMLSLIFMLKSKNEFTK